MSLPSITRVSPFTRAVVQAMRRLYPESLADRSFDNTGLLLEAPCSVSSSSSSSSPSSSPSGGGGGGGGSRRRQANSVLLTIDLTRAVADEAIARRASVVVAYHPIIFRGLKSITLADSQQQSLLRLAAEGISVYSPHTAVDAAPGGLADWMADIVTGTPVGANATATAIATAVDAASSAADEAGGGRGGETGAKTGQGVPARPAAQRTYSSPAYPQDFSSGRRAPADQGGATSHSRAAINPISSPPKGFEGAGYGRMVTFKEAQPLSSLIDRIARGMGSPKGFPVAVPQGRNADELSIRTVAICAGSGGDLFRGVNADLFFTGELSHHSALALTENGSAVITLFHSNSERGFLHDVLKQQLLKAVEEEWETMRTERSSQKAGEYGEQWSDFFADKSVEVETSERDRDPYGIVVLQED